MKELLFYANYKVPKHASKKNSRPIFKNSRTGKTFLGKDKTLLMIENIHLAELHYANQAIDLPSIDFEVEAHFYFYFPKDKYFTKPKSKKDKLKPSLNNGDKSNLAQLIEDELQKAKVITNDSLLNPIFIEKLPTDHDTFYVEVKLFKKE